MHAWTSDAFMRTSRAKSISWKIRFRECYCTYDVDREETDGEKGRFLCNIKAALWEEGLRISDSHPGSHHRPQHDWASYWISLCICIIQPLFLAHKHKTSVCVCVICIGTLKHFYQNISKTIWAAESQEVGNLSFTFRDLVLLCTGKSTTLTCCRMRFNYALQNWFTTKFSGMQECCSWLVLIAFLWTSCFSKSEAQMLTYKHGHNC